MGRSVIFEVKVSKESPQYSEKNKNFCLHIKVSEGTTLEKFQRAINKSINFYNDQLHSFYMDNNPHDSKEEYTIENDELNGVSGYTNRVKLSKFNFKIGSKFIYHFDFGDCWYFQINVLDVIEESIKKSVILKKEGKVIQYPDYES